MHSGVDSRAYDDSKLTKQISCIKYTLLCFNIVTWIVGAALFGLSIWVRTEPGFVDWISKLEIRVFFIGIYILIAVGIIVMGLSFLGCLSSLMENALALYIFIGSQILGFVLSVVGSAVLLNFSTMQSSLQPMIRDIMTRFVMTSEYPRSAAILRMIQEAIGCCGADGPNDYLNLHQPLPAQCRDTITGNAFFFGCVDSLTWFLEEKAAWVAALAMSLAMLMIIDGVLSFVLIQALKKEEKNQ